MIQTAIRLTSTVLPGSRIEFTAPELTEGESVELIVLRAENAELPKPQQFASAWEYLQSLAPIERTLEEWSEVESEFYAERNSWGD